jgi:hypothetical protein
MTIINQTYKFIFVHIPKNAGTTATKILSDYTHWCDLELGGTAFGESLAEIYHSRFGIGKHTKAQAIKKIVGDNVWSEYYKFALVRNPFSRTLSAYRFLKKWKNWQNSEIMDRFDTFESFVASEFFLASGGPDGMFNPQHSWVNDGAGNKLVNFVGKVEMIEQTIAHISDAIGLNVALASIPHINESGKIDEHLTAYSSISAPIVLKRYEKDFTDFGYEKTIAI